MSEIIFPIKCSTLKTIDEIIGWMCFIEMHIYGILASYTMISTVPSADKSFINGIWALMVFFGFMTLIFCIIIDVIELYKILPGLSCIKDETERGA